MKTSQWPEDPRCVPPRLAPFVPVAPDRRPWLQPRPLPVHVARTVTVACGPGLLRAAENGKGPHRL
jgi:hypothetical protein